jgi:hypothetical protein
MSITPTRAVTRFLGGESGHRSFFGGTHSKSRILLLAIFGFGGMVLTILIGWPGLLFGVAGVGITFLLTARTHRGSIIERRTRRSRWKKRVRTGTDAFVPYEVGSWDQLQEAVNQAKSLKGKQRRRALWTAQRAAAAMRANPDGSDGIGWLQMGRGEPGIAWHAPLGEQPYLSVAFTVTGQLRGIESTSVMARAAESWGQFLASRAAPSSLVKRAEVSTRVLPADSALQEFWVLNSLDPATPAEAIHSYEEVLRLTGEDAMVQRHFVTVVWPLAGAFYDAASKHGEGRDGWRALMKQEIAAAITGLKEARLGQVEPLTARQVTATVLHQQNPSRPIDYVADANPASMGVASHDEFSAHVVAGVDPITEQPVEWWHRTAAIRSENMATAARSQLWVLDLLIGKDLRFTRTVTFHIDLIPAAEAKTAAKQDLVRDTAEKLSRREAGQVDTGDTDVKLSSAQRRARDLVSGSQHHGAAWVGYVTISARDRDGLAEASRQLADVCANGLGIEQLEWLDSYQSAGSGTTWPIGRGIGTAPSTFSARVYNRLAGKSEKEAIS